MSGFCIHFGCVLCQPCQACQLCQPSHACSASPAREPTGRQFGSRVAQVWPRCRLKGSLLEKRGTWPKPCYLLCFRSVWVGLGRHWAARGRPWRPFWRQRAPLCRHKDTLVQLGSMETVGNERKRMQTDRNGRELSQTRAGSEVKVYLKAKTYD